MKSPKVTKQKPVRVAYINGEPWIRVHDGQVWTIFDGTPPPPPPELDDLEKNEKRPKRSSIRQKRGANRARRRA